MFQSLPQGQHNKIKHFGKIVGETALASAGCIIILPKMHHAKALPCLLPPKMAAGMFHRSLILADWNKYQDMYG